jgi:drug/metabolite transporter (DMT)-like permease
MKQEATTRPAYGWWFLNPYVQIGLGALLVTTSELLLKRGATATAQIPLETGWLGIGALASGWVWLGILTYLLAFLSWLQVLRFLPVNIAFALMSVVQVLVPLGAWVFLHEAIAPARWCGILLVLGGIAVIARPMMTVEEKL